MNGEKREGAAVIVIFGAAGDLTGRKLIPALFKLFVDGLLPDQFAVVGFDRKEMSDVEFRRQLLDRTVSTPAGDSASARWEEFATRLSYMLGDFADPSAFKGLGEKLGALERTWGKKPERIFYMAIPPAMIEIVARQIGQTTLCADAACSRIVVEKPFGRDLSSAKNLNRILATVFKESQIYRIDHYLGKETVQNILAFRFANALFEPIWDRRYIDHIQITMAEQVGIEHRGAYYDRAGALRDIVQNHLMQILCLIAMEPPVSFQDEEIRNKKADVLHAIRPIPTDQVHRFAVRGQYGAGWIEGKHMAAYREEPGVSPDSPTETYAAVKLFVDNWRWQDVPFYLRSGKRLPLRVCDVVIQFRPVPHVSFPSSAVEAWQSNRLIIRIQPEEGILLRFQAKHPGRLMSLSQVDMRFSYREAFRSVSPDAYETLLLDVMLGDATLFMRADQVEEAWGIVEPILQGWAEVVPQDFPNYPSGSWGPQAADVLIAQDGRNWLTPNIAAGASMAHDEPPTAASGGSPA